MNVISYALGTAVAATGIVAFIPRLCPAPPIAAPAAISSGAASGAGERMVFRVDPVAQTVTADDRSFESSVPPRTARSCSVQREGRYVYLCAYRSYLLGRVSVK